MGERNMTSGISQITKQVYSRLEQKGYAGRIVAIKHLDDLKEEIERRRNQGVFDEALYQAYLAGFEFGIPEHFPDAKSLVITSAPQPQRRVNFNFKGRLYHLIIPPTYSYETDEIVENILSDILKPRGFNLYPAVVPVKLLAVHSGLAKYGKNNITYVEGMGSFHKLKAFLSDLPAVEDIWLGLQLLEQCNTCTACIKQCPTGAIVPHRFLIQAEKCLTFHNERPEEFPDWIEPSWHNCLIGCMYCQLACPANKRFFRWFDEEESFTEEETEAILRGTSLNQFPEATVEKLRRTFLSDQLDVLPRNLNVLLEQRLSRCLIISSLSLR